MPCAGEGKKGSERDSTFGWDYAGEEMATSFLSNSDLFFSVSLKQQHCLNNCPTNQ